jgi:hypothetical protein
MVGVVAFGLILGVAWPADSSVARIETTAPLRSHAEESVQAALKEAVDAAVKGAVAMGLPWVHLNRAVVLADAVAVQILATDTAPEAEPEAEMDEAPGPDAKPGTGSDQAEETLL